MALIQYSPAGVPVAVHVTAAEWERLKRVADVGTTAQMFHGLRVYVMPEPRTLRWWQRARAWVIARWRDWEKRVLAPEPLPTPKRKPAASKPPDWLTATIFRGYYPRPTSTSWVRITPA